MDTASSISRSNVIYGVEVVGFRESEHLNLTTSLNYGGCKFFGDSRLLLKAHSGAAITLYINRAEKISQLFQQPDIMTTSIDEVSTTAKPLVRKLRNLPQKMKKLMDMLPHQEINEEEASLLDVLWLLLASVIFVSTFQKFPGGSAVHDI